MKMNSFTKNKGAVVLAAGYSRRMSSFKPLLDVGGKPAIQRVIDALKDGGIPQTVIVTGYNRELLLSFIDGINTVEAYNAEYDQGMFSSVLTGIRKLLEISGNSLEGFLLTPVDQAAVTSDIIRLIISDENVCSKFVVACYMGKSGHPLWVPFRFIDEILSCSGDAGVRGVTEKYADEVVRLETGAKSVVMDMNTDEEYEKLLAYWEKTGEKRL